MQSYNYMIVRVEHYADDEVWLNDMARDGWRLVAVNNFHMYLEKANP